MYSYSQAVLCGEFFFFFFLIDTPQAVLWGAVFLIDTPQAVLCEEFFLIDTPLTVLCGEFLLHALCYFMWGRFVSATPPCCFTRVVSRVHAVLFGEFLLHTVRSFIWGVYVTVKCPVLYVGSSCYGSRAISCGEFLIH